MKTLKTYKAFAKNKETGERKVITLTDYESKNDVLFTLRQNGYSCSNCFCKEEEVFNWVWEEIMEVELSEERQALWRFPRIPKDQEEYDEMMDKYLMQYFKANAR